MNNKKYRVLLIIQLLVILLVGIVSGDAAYAVGISLIGVVFNFLVSINNPIGFLFGFVYAITNGIMAYYTGIYATFIFMLLLQAPMAIYSFKSWGKKKKSSDAIMKKMSLKQIIGLSFSMIVLGIVMYFVLKAFNSTSILIDDIFFIFSVSACLLLAFCYKNAYIITLISGICGTVLWTYQMLETGNGFSIAAFYMIVSINSIIAVYEQYIKQIINERK